MIKNKDKENLYIFIVENKVKIKNKKRFLSVTENIYRVSQA
jgi:hypothetical protein